MTVDPTFVVGMAATIIGTFLMLPQVYKSVRTKSVGDVSWAMVLLYVVNCVLWLVYGVLIGAVPVIVTNGIALCIGLLQVGLKGIYSSK